ncbi:hypothetical protein BDY24DRAFT_273677 [Mrakia frigida]|uniref:GPI-anchor transamidase GPI18 n=1 Tax=Mrakia frigida TaxID=29902 RepID=UPI003FCC1C69
MAFVPSSPSLPSLLFLSLSYRLFITFLLRLFTLYVPLFDRSPDFILPHSSFLQAFVRWDVVWFLRIIQNGGYTHEQETAFAPGWLWVMKKMGSLVGNVKRSGGLEEMSERQSRLASVMGGKGVEDLILGGVIASWLAGMMATVVLYRLTLRLTSSPSFAHLTSLVYILSPSPGALISPYTEPLYALFTFSGMLASTSPSDSKHRLPRLLLATLFFAAATSVRPLGIMNAGYLIWGVVVEPWLQGRGRGWKVLPRLLLASVLTLLIAAPFIKTQHTFYHQFCTPRLPPASARPIWCDRRVPVVYTFVQREYWNVGFLSYFTPSQFPNFLVSAPLYLLLLHTHLFTLPHQYTTYIHPLIPRSLACFLTELASTLARTFLPNIILEETRRTLSPGENLLATNPEMLPYLIHSLVLTGVLFFNSHVQIVLRLAQTNPVVWWGVASLVGRREGGFVEPKVVLPEEEVVGEVVEEETKLGEQKEGEEEQLERSTPPDSTTSTHKPLRKRRRVGSPTAHVVASEEESGKVVVEGKRRMYFLGRVYLGWVVLWGLVATLLWAGFYPPA